MTNEFKITLKDSINEKLVPVSMTETFEDFCNKIIQRLKKIEEQSAYNICINYNEDDDGLGVNLRVHLKEKDNFIL